MKFILIILICFLLISCTENSTEEHKIIVENQKTIIKNQELINQNIKVLLDNENIINQNIKNTCAK